MNRTTKKQVKAALKVLDQALNYDGIMKARQWNRLEIGTRMLDQAGLTQEQKEMVLVKHCRRNERKQKIRKFFLKNA